MNSPPAGLRALASLLRSRMRGAVQQDQPLAPHTYYQIGGPADLCVTPADTDDLALAVSLLAEQGCPMVVLGGGSNVLVSDLGVRGAVVLTSGLDTLEVTSAGRIRCGAGLQSHAVARAARDAGLRGAEFLTCLPGSIGGACYMNARAYGGELAGVLAGVVTVDRQGRPGPAVLDAAGFAYKRSPFQRSGELIAELTLALEPGQATQIRQRMEQIEASRTQRHELDFPSCGCVFKNDHSVGVPSGVLVDRCGLKGLRRGPVQVSPYHGNFVFNLGGASAAQVRAMMDHLRATVAQRHGHQLVYEVQFLGQWEQGR